MGRTIGGIFGRSAFGPIFEHMVKVQDCIALLSPLVGAFAEADRGEVRRLADEMHRREGEADRIKNEIRRSLSRSFFTSVERSEMLYLLKAQDDISDSCDEVAKLLEMRDTPLPREMSASFTALARQVAATGAVLAEIVDKLQAFEENPNPRAQIEQVGVLIDRLQADEHEVSLREHDALKDVFREEQRIDPVSVIFLMQIARQLGETIGAVQNTVDVIERMIGRR